MLNYGEWFFLCNEKAFITRNAKLLLVLKGVGTRIAIYLPEDFLPFVYNHSNRWKTIRKS